MANHKVIQQKQTLQCKPSSNLNDWIYVYYIRDDLLLYDRSVSRQGLGLNRAKELVDQWEKKGCESFYTIGTLTKKDALS